MLDDKNSVISHTAEMRSIEAGLQGLPDFGRPLQTRVGMIYGAYQSKAYRVLPYLVTLQKNEAGSASVRLSLVRGEMPFMPPEPYGVLGLKIQAHYASTEILKEFRAEIPELVLQEIRSDSGFIRLISVPDTTASSLVLPAEVRKVNAVSWDGGNALRLNLRTSLESAEMLEQMILQDTLAARIFTEFELTGVCPRQACTVDFEADVLLDKVKSRLSVQGRIGLEELHELFVSNLDHFVFQDENGSAVQFQGAALIAVIDILIDRFNRRFARFVARDDITGPEQISLSGSGVPEPGGLIHWDLSRAIQVSRMLMLQSPGLNRLDASLEQRQRMIERIVLPVMRAGSRSIQVYANLAGRPVGLFLIGVHLSVSPAPPDRPQEILRSLELDETEFQGSAMLPLAVSEPLHYRYQGFISIQSDVGVVNFLGAVSDETDEEILVLSPHTFGARFISLSISKVLAELTVVSGLLEFTHSGQKHRICFKLNQEHDSIALVVPDDDELPLLGLSAEPIGAGAVINLELHVVDGLHFDLPVFSEYGPHSVELHCQLHPDILFCQIEYVEEEKTNNPNAYETLIFFQDQGALSQVCHWFAENPFAPGFCYRISINGGDPNAWSTPVRDFLNLTLDIKLIESGSNSNDAISVVASSATTLGILN